MGVRTSGLPGARCGFADEHAAQYAGHQLAGGALRRELMSAFSAGTSTRWTGAAHSDPARRRSAADDAASYPLHGRCGHIDLHETTDTDGSSTARGGARRQGLCAWHHPDGFYLVDDTNPQPAFQQAVLGRVAQVYRRGQMTRAASSAAMWCRGGHYARCSPTGLCASRRERPLHHHDRGHPARAAPGSRCRAGGGGVCGEWSLCWHKPNP
jgi:hypothetical protein